MKNIKFGSLNLCLFQGFEEIILSTFVDVDCYCYLMHQFLWNASNVDASSSESPRRSDRRRLNVVAEADAFTEVRSLLGSGQASRSPSNDLKILICGWISKSFFETKRLKIFGWFFFLPFCIFFKFANEILFF